MYCNLDLLMMKIIMIMAVFYAILSMKKIINFLPIMIRKSLCYDSDSPTMTKYYETIPYLM